MRIAVAGYGNVGRETAELLTADPRFALVGISDVTGARYDAGGLDPAAIAAELDGALVSGPAGGAAGHSGAAGAPSSGGARGIGALSVGAPLDRDDLLTCDCDVLVPASVQGVLHAGNAQDVRARVVVEGANGPTTRAADALLDERGVLVVPDVLANAGGVIVSYFEWAQGLQAMPWTPAWISERMVATMRTAFEAVVAESEQRRLSLRDAALCLGVQRVADAHVARGLYP